MQCFDIDKYINNEYYCKQREEDVLKAKNIIPSKLFN